MIVETLNDINNKQKQKEINNKKFILIFFFFFAIRKIFCNSKKFFQKNFPINNKKYNYTVSAQVIGQVFKILTKKLVKIAFKTHPINNYTKPQSIT